MSSPDGDPMAPRPWFSAPAPSASAAWQVPDLEGIVIASSPVPVEDETGPVVETLSMEEQAYQLGVQAGIREGLEQAEQELAPFLATLGELAGALESSRERFRSELARNLHALALAIAHHLFQRAADADPAVVRDLVERAIALLPSEESIDIRAHPLDLEALRGGPPLAGPGGRTVSVHWTGDPLLERGSFVLDSPHRLVDGRIDVALRALYERLAHD